MAIVNGFIGVNNNNNNNNLDMNTFELFYSSRVFVCLFVY